MKSMSTMPPAAYFRSQTSSSPFSSAMARRMSATSVATLAARAAAVSTSRMMFSILARNSGDAEITRARVSAMCSQVQASRSWYSAKEFEARGHRPGPAGGAQPHVHVIQHAVIGPGGECADQPLGEAREIMRAVQGPRAVGVRLFVIEIIEQDQIEIGRRRSSRGCRAGPSRGSRSPAP